MAGNDPGEVKPSPGSFGFLCMLLSVCFSPDTAVAGAVVSVKYGFPVFAAGGGKAHTDLLIGILLLGKLRKTVLGEPAGFYGFDIGLKVAAQCSAQDENFADAVRMQRRVVLCQILDIKADRTEMASAK